MKAFAAKLLGAATATVVAAGCAAGPHVFVQQRDVLVRPDLDHDQVRVLVLDRGVTAGGLSLDPSLHYVDELLAGGAFAPSGLPVLDPGALDSGLDAEVEGTVFYLDESDGLCLAQAVRLEGVSNAISRANETARANVLANRDPDASSFVWQWGFHPAFWRAAEAQWVFFRFDGSRLVIDLPCDESVPADETDLQRSLYGNSDVDVRRSEDRVSVTLGPPDGDVWEIRTSTRRLAPIELVATEKDGKVVLEGKPGRWRELSLLESLCYVLLTTCSPEAYDSRLCDALRETKRPVRTDISTASLRNAFLANDPAPRGAQP